MPKYLKRPVVREAEQFTRDHVLGLKPLPAGVVKEVSGDPSSLEGARVEFYVVTCHKQRSYLSVGDYVIAEPTGDGHYPCAAPVFEAEYDPLPHTPG